jgi:integrase
VCESIVARLVPHARAGAPAARLRVEFFVSGGWCCKRGDGARAGGSCDVDLDRGYVTVLQGKFKKDRVVPIGKVAVHFIREYLTKARPHMLRGSDTPEARLFLSSNGTPLAQQSLYGAIRRVAKSPVWRSASSRMASATRVQRRLRGRADTVTSSSCSVTSRCRRRRSTRTWRSEI